MEVGTSLPHVIPFLEGSSDAVQSYMIVLQKNAFQIDLLHLVVHT